MRVISNSWSEQIGSMYELSDIEVGSEYVCNKKVDPKYLSGDKVVCTRVNKKTITVSNLKYPDEKFYIYPYMLEVKENR